MVKSKNVRKTKAGKSAEKKAKQNMTVGELEQLMLQKFPAETACEWDVTGITVGDATQKIKKVAVALDPTPEAIKKAELFGANVLVTHHPIFVNRLESLVPGVWAYEAASRNVALMNFHTALDVSEIGSSVIPSMLDFKPKEHGLSGFGRVCKVKPEMILKQLAVRCRRVFGRNPRIWGNLDTKINYVLTNSGSSGVIEDDIDCLITGEIKYHDALEMQQRGKCVIEIGHDVSELPFVETLTQEIIDCGVRKEDIVVVDQTHNWINLESIESN